MRNAPFTLSPSQAARVGGYAASLRKHHAAHTTVTVSFTTRDNEPRTYTGTIAKLTGEGSHAVAVIDTGAGFKSANVYNITAVSA